MTPRRSPRQSPRRSTRRSPRSPFLSTGDEFGPGADNLQLLLDWEDYTAGTDLTNVYPDTSGIQSLTANNNPGVETTSPIVGQQSGDYEADNSEYHSHSYSSPLEPGTEDFYVSIWPRLESKPGSFMEILSLYDGTNGWLMQWQADTGSWFARFTDGSGTSQDLAGGSPTVGSADFIEMFINDGTFQLRINDTDIVSTAITGSTSGSASFSLAARSDGTSTFDGQIDSVLVEKASSLFWPNHSTWLYNSGNGRSSDEILSYDP